MDVSDEKRDGCPDWLVIFLLVALILGKGFFAYHMVGDRGQPDWDYRPVRDLPGESPYAIFEALPHPQHIKGEKGE